MVPENWNPNGESYDFAVEDYLNNLSNAIKQKLSSYSIEINGTEARHFVKKWFKNLEENRPDEILGMLADRHNSIDELSSDIVRTVLLDIAEERPGTNPWAHEPTIPLPEHLLPRISATLSACSIISAANGAHDWALNATANSLAANNYHASAIAKGKVIEDDEAEILINDEIKSYRGRILLIPQPASAYLARFFENTLMRIIDQNWVVPKEINSWTETIATLKIESDLLRHLNSLYGRKASPGTSS
jgi:hypothetical protein